MRSAEGRDDIFEPLGGNDGLDAKLGQALLPPRSPSAGFVSSPPWNVPVPAAYQEQRS